MGHTLHFLFQGCDGAVSPYTDLQTCDPHLSPDAPQSHDHQAVDGRAGIVLMVPKMRRGWIISAISWLNSAGWNLSDTLGRHYKQLQE